MLYYFVIPSLVVFSLFLGTTYFVMNEVPYCDDRQSFWVMVFLSILWPLGALTILVSYIILLKEKNILN